MPTYTFKNADSGEIEEHFMKISELDAFRQSNPHLSTVIGSSTLVRDSGRMKPDDNFRDLLKTIKKGNRRSNINTW